MLEKITVPCDACDGKGTWQIITPESLRKTREDAGVSLRAMAKRLNFSAAYISDVEHGRRNCTTIIEVAYSSLNLKRTKQPTRK